MKCNNSRLEQDFCDLRHTFGSRLRMEGRDLRTFMEIMDHTWPEKNIMYPFLSWWLTQDGFPEARKGTMALIVHYGEHRQVKTNVHCLFGNDRAFIFPLFGIWDIQRKKTWQKSDIIPIGQCWHSPFDQLKFMFNFGCYLAIYDLFRYPKREKRLDN